MLERKLDAADRDLKAGDLLAAKKTWEGIVRLYNGNQAVVEYVAKAQSHLDEIGAGHVLFQVVENLDSWYLLTLLANRRYLVTWFRLRLGT